MTTATQTGSVVSLWRYPVKSMMGEELNAADVTERGLLGDRSYALVDPADGKVASFEVHPSTVKSTVADLRRRLDLQAKTTVSCLDHKRKPQRLHAC